MGNYSRVAILMGVQQALRDTRDLVLKHVSLQKTIIHCEIKKLSYKWVGMCIFMYIFNFEIAHVSYKCVCLNFLYVCRRLFIFA